MSRPIHFYLNDAEIRSPDPAGMLVLDFVRRRAGLTGTKEGCREGDCGACVVLIGTLEGENICYRPIPSCLMPLDAVHGKHLVTIEGINMASLSPVQQAIVDEGATQCGFCTPGIVVSLTGSLMEAGAVITQDSINTALSGHLCRCTGYRSLKAVVDHLQNAMGEASGLEALVDKEMLPAYFLDMPARLGAIPPLAKLSDLTERVIIAGGTDIYVQRGDTLSEVAVDVLTQHPQMHGIAWQNGYLRVGALTTFEEFANHPEVSRLIPAIKEYMFLIASLQIRNRATLGGNIVNASPIGDMTILLLALESQLVLEDGDASRTVPMTRFFKGYKQLDKMPSEILTEILIPVFLPDTQVHWEKVSKRKCLDIATVNSAIRVRTEKGAMREVGLAMGGVAPVPLFMAETSRYLKDRPVSTETVEEALDIAQQEITPISDVRGSVAYKRLLVRQFIIAHFARLFPEQIDVEAFYETS